MSTQKESAIFINRELSWLEFNRRVLDLSRDKKVPLGEQCKFTAIYGSNLDEFFMVRVGSLLDQTLLKGESRENKTGMTPKQQLQAIMPKVAELQQNCDADAEKLFKRLAELGLEKVNFSKLEKPQLQFWKKYFLSELFPVLSPQIVDRRHPFPFLRDRETYVGVILKDGKSEVPLLGLIPVSSQFERLVVVEQEGKRCFTLVEELILQYAEVAFGKNNVLEKCLFRVTRNADINAEEGMFDHDIDYRVVMGELLKKRRKLAPVRLQLKEPVSTVIRDYLLEELELAPHHSFVQQAPLDLSFFFMLSSRLEKENRPELFYPEAKPIQPDKDYNLYQAVQHKYILMCYPYQSMRPFITMLQEAATDPTVISIKMTLYRVARYSKIIEALIAAAENGKEVVTIVELRARFDEQNNIDWSRQLEDAGCTVIYGFTDYKVHSKITLITRKTESGFSYISQIGTGNYNEKTSELYTDLSFVSSNPAIGEEIGTVFNNLAVERLTETSDTLIVAPLHFKNVLLQEIEKEVEYQKQGGTGRVVIKCNSISDKAIIETLSEASIAGVSIDMIVRGICCLQAGLPELTENITVRSLVGRYLEHSRIYAFGEGERFRVYIASGDFLTRNTERRVEVGVRIDDAEIKVILQEILEMQLADNVNSRKMELGGTYAKTARKKEAVLIDSQMEMYTYILEKQPKLEQKIRQFITNEKRETEANTIEEKTVAQPITKEQPLAPERPSSFFQYIKNWFINK